MLKIIIAFYKKSLEAIKTGITLDQIRKTKIRSEITKMKLAYKNEDALKFDELLKEIEAFSFEAGRV
jgi:vacuolar-type H+-ATPase catalytic subunit A/Vma1